MGIVVALDVHRNQITYKLLDRDTGEVRRGGVAPAARVDVRTWLAQFAGHEVEFALEGTTGWRFVVEEIERAGYRAHLAGRRRGRPSGPRAACQVIVARSPPLALPNGRM